MPALAILVAAGLVVAQPGGGGPFADVLTALFASPVSNTAPMAAATTELVPLGNTEPIPVRITASDADFDTVSFSISEHPAQGTVFVDEPVTRNTWRLMYAPDADFAGNDTFVVVPHDGTDAGRPATITMIAETLPAGTTE